MFFKNSPNICINVHETPWKNVFTPQWKFFKNRDFGFGNLLKNIRRYVDLEKIFYQ